MTELGAEESTAEKTPVMVSPWPEKQPKAPKEIDHLRGRFLRFLGGEQGREMEVFFDRGAANLIREFNQEIGGRESNLEDSVLNKTFLYEWLRWQYEQGLERAWCLVGDLDHLKGYNTYFGEPEGGDQAIREFLVALLRMSRERWGEIGYWTVRYDGDTFMVLLSEEAGRKSEGFEEAVNGKLLKSRFLPGMTTEAFEERSGEEKGLILDALVPPQVTFSSLSDVSFKPEEGRGWNEVFNQELGRLNMEIRRKKEAKLSPAKKQLMERLG